MTIKSARIEVEIDPSTGALGKIEVVEKGHLYAKYVGLEVEAAGRPVLVFKVLLGRRDFVIGPRDPDFMQLITACPECGFDFTKLEEEDAGDDKAPHQKQ